MFAFKKIRIEGGHLCRHHCGYACFLVQSVELHHSTSGPFKLSHVCLWVCTDIIPHTFTMYSSVTLMQPEVCNLTDCTTEHAALGVLAYPFLPIRLPSFLRQAVSLVLTGPCYPCSYIVHYAMQNTGMESVCSMYWPLAHPFCKRKLLFLKPCLYSTTAATLLYSDLFQ